RIAASRTTLIRSCSDFLIPSPFRNRRNRCQTPFPGKLVSDTFFGHLFRKKGCQTPVSAKKVSDTFFRRKGVRHLFLRRRTPFRVRPPAPRRPGARARRTRRACAPRSPSS